MTKNDSEIRFIWFTMEPFSALHTCKFCRKPTRGCVAWSGFHHYDRCQKCENENRQAFELEMRKLSGENR